MANTDQSRKGLPSDETIVSKAAIRAARALHMTNVELSDVLGVSEPQLSRIASDSALLKRESKEFELAVLFIRLFRSLDAIVGGDENSAAAWIRGNNLAFDQKPIDRIKRVEGLVDVISYLDSRRAPV